MVRSVNNHGLKFLDFRIKVSAKSRSGYFFDLKNFNF